MLLATSVMTLILTLHVHLTGLELILYKKIDSNFKRKINMYLQKPQFISVKWKYTSTYDKYACTTKPKNN